jgi:uncharacterized protein (TIGR02001 family)
MTKSLLCLAILAASFATAAQAADAPAVATNLSLTSNYKYRGTDQSSHKPAVQGGFDFAHSSGFYVGNWNSSISAAAGIEMDVYGGYKHEINKSLALDVGLLHYYYPNAGLSKTTELYGGLTMGPVTGKLSYAVSKRYFGVEEGRGTIYADTSVNQPLTKTLTLNAHIGATLFDGGGKSVGGGVNYVDYKLGATYDLGSGFSAAAALVGGNKKVSYTGNTGRLIATITKSM